MEKKLDKKKLFIIILSAIVAIVAIVSTIIILVGGKKDAYRNIKVYQVMGDALITREEIGEISAYDNMVLQSGDQITMTQGRMTLQLDEDKYVYVEEGAELRLEATGTAENSRTTIYLAKGEITNDIQNKLSADSSYEVNTPNSTMSVRGTVFYVNVYEEDGVVYTKVCVSEGKVETNLIYSDGTVANESKIVDVDNGNQVIVYEDSTVTDYLTDVEPIKYEEIPEEVQQIIGKIIEGRSNSSEEVTENTTSSEPEEPKGPYNVTFLNGNTEFGMQVVQHGAKATVPRLKPDDIGHWDHDFNTPIEADTEIHWVIN